MTLLCKHGNESTDRLVELISLFFLKLVNLLVIQFTLVFVSILEGSTSLVKKSNQIRVVEGKSHVSNLDSLLVENMWSLIKNALQLLPEPFLEGKDLGVVLHLWIVGIDSLEVINQFLRYVKVNSVISGCDSLYVILLHLNFSVSVQVKDSYEH